MKLLHKTDHLPEGYTNVYGVQLNKHEIGAYNALCDKIDQWQKAGYSARENDLNARHKIISRIE